MSRHHGPRRNTAAYRALAHLYALGGKANANQLASVSLAEFSSPKRFDKHVAAALLNFKMVRVTGDLFTITHLGRQFIASGDAIAQNPAAYIGKLAPPRVPSEFKPLNPAIYTLAISGREGAMDYRQIPSLMAGQRVAFRGKES